ncbi:hypothetical protein OO017_14845, partial [Pontibacter sp. M82]|nr:hypothetical protein [Pontibacter anaerobius]
MSLLVGAVAFSCEQKEQDEVVPSSELNAEATSLLTSANLLFEELFEGGSPLSGIYTETAGSHSLQYVSTHSFGGSRSARFELRDTDPMVNAGT